MLKINFLRNILKLRHGLRLFALCVAPGIATTALAAGEQTGPYLTLEGMMGRLSAHQTGENGSVSTAPLEDNKWGQMGTEISDTKGSRIEAGWKFKTSSGTPWLLGIAYSRWTGQENGSSTVNGWVYGEPPPAGQAPQAEISLCADNNQCKSFDSAAYRKYNEITAKFSTAVASGEHGLYWVGIQPFYGKIAEESHTAIISGNIMRGTDNTLTGQLFGAMLTGQKEFALTDADQLVLSAGVGAYVLKSNNTSIGRNLGGVEEDHVKVYGRRAQLGATLKHMINSNLSIGATALADFWSDQPYVAGRAAGDPGVRCSRPAQNLVCEPPRWRGRSHIEMDSLTNLFFGVNVTLQY